MTYLARERALPQEHLSHQFSYVLCLCLVALYCSLGRVGSRLPLPSLVAAHVFPVPTDMCTLKSGQQGDLQRQELLQCLPPALDPGIVSCR